MKKELKNKSENLKEINKEDLDKMSKDLLNSHNLRRKQKENKLKTLITQITDKKVGKKKK